MAYFIFFENFSENSAKSGKDLYVKKRNDSAPLLKVLEGLLRRGAVDSCQRAGGDFADDDKYLLLWNRQERRLCPRVHLDIDL
nr:hypothetical protein [Alistipes onderdonkii]